MAEKEQQRSQNPATLAQGILEQNLNALLERHKPPTVLWVLSDLLHQKDNGAWNKTVMRLEEATNQAVADEEAGASYE